MKKDNAIKMKRIHQYCNQNRDVLKNDIKCGCFFCMQIYNSKEIKEWIDTKNNTALCPHCGIDSVLPESDQYVLSEELLEEMHKYWFE